MQPRFALNAATIKSSPLDRQIELAQANGFRQVGLWLSDVEAEIAKGRSVSEIRSQLDGAGLGVAELCFLGGWQDTDDAGFPEVLKKAHRLCEISRGLGCELIIVVPALGPGHLAHGSERFRQVCAVA